MIPQRLILTNNAHYLQCKMNIFTLSLPYLLILTFTFAFWPLTSSWKYKSTHCLSQHIMLQIAIERAHQSFLYFTVIFHLKWKQSVCYRDFICQKWFRKWPVWISLVYCTNQHNFWWRHPREMPLLTWWLEDNILWTLNNVFGKKMAILQAIWAQIQSSMYLRWYYISFYQL